MKRVLLISNEVLHYRQKVYNYFFDEFQKDGYEFHVFSDSFQEVGIPNKFVRHDGKLVLTDVMKSISKINPDVVILFLHLKNIVMIPTIFYCKSKGIPVIYWNHGINITDPDNRVKNAAFKFIHNQCDALITYSPDMKRYFSRQNQKKLFIGYNTINLSDIDKTTLPTKKETRKKYGIKENKVLLMVARLTPGKKADVLVRLFGGEHDVAVVLVGPGMYEALSNEIDKHDNVYYLGEKYGDEINAIYKMGDVFTVPGAIGLALNEAMFWGLPTVLNDVIHGPEIYYMKDSKTGYIAEDEQEYKMRILQILGSEESLKKISQNCLDVYEKEVSIDRMYQGFWDAIHYCEMNRRK